MTKVDNLGTRIYKLRQSALKDFGVEVNRKRRNNRKEANTSMVEYKFNSTLGRDWRDFIGDSMKII